MKTTTSITTVKQKLHLREWTEQIIAPTGKWNNSDSILSSEWYQSQDLLLSSSQSSGTLCRMRNLQ